MIKRNLTRTTLCSRFALRKFVLATFLTGSVALVGIADARAADAAHAHDTTLRTAGPGDAGEGASFRTSGIGDAGEGASFRTSGTGEAGEGASRPA